MKDFLDHQMRTLTWQNMKDSCLLLEDFGSKHAIGTYFHKLPYKIMEIAKLQLGVLPRNVFVFRGAPQSLGDSRGVVVWV